MIKLYFIHLIDFLFTKFHHWTKIYTFNVVILLGNTESMMKYNPKTAILQNKMKKPDTEVHIFFISNLLM